MNQYNSKKIAALVAATLMASVLASIFVVDTSSASTRTGFVTSGGDALEGVTVEYFNTATGDSSSTSTDEYGFFQFDDLADGNYMFSFSNSGYLNQVADVEVMDNNANMNIDMEATNTTSDFMGIMLAERSETYSATEWNFTEEFMPFNSDNCTSTYISHSNQVDTWWGADDGYSYTVNSESDWNDTAVNFFYDEVNLNETFTLRTNCDGYFTSHETFNADWSIALIDGDEIDVWGFENAWTDGMVLASLESHEAFGNDVTAFVWDSEGIPMSGTTMMAYETSTSTWSEGESDGIANKFTLRDGEHYLYVLEDGYATVVEHLMVDGDTTHNINMPASSGSNHILAIPSIPVSGAMQDLPMSNGHRVVLNEAPTVTATAGGMLSESYTIGLNTSVDFNSTVSDDVHTALTYGWDFQDGSTSSETDDSHTFMTEGVYNVSLTVTDAFGASSTEYVLVTVDGTNPTSAFDITVKTDVTDNGTAYNATNAEQGNTLVFNGSSSNDGMNVSASSYFWDYGDGTNGTGNPVSKTYETPGTYTISLTVTDAAGNSDTSSTPVIIHDTERPSQVTFTFGYETPGLNNTTKYYPSTSKEGELTYFNASATDNIDNMSTMNFAWSFGDDSDNVSGMGEMYSNVSHVFESAGNYQVILQVTDHAGNEAESYSYNLTVASKERPDVWIADLSLSSTDVTEGSTVSITAELGVQGMNITDSFTVSFYSNIDGEDTLIANYTMSDGFMLDENGTANYTEISVSWSVGSSGTYSIWASADSGKVIDESEEGNNDRSLSKVDVGGEIDEGFEWSSILFFVIVVVVALGAVGYINRDKLF
tara:strand:+ start:576 stop:3044 length:2469 start_codon:yes stop_codon:yes gene_type:complete